MSQMGACAGHTPVWICQCNVFQRCVQSIRSVQKIWGFLVIETNNNTIISYITVMLKIITAPSTDEARVAHVPLGHPLPVSELRECVDYDTEDNVQTDGCDENEE